MKTVQLNQYRAVGSDGAIVTIIELKKVITSGGSYANPSWLETGDGRAVRRLGHDQFLLKTGEILQALPSPPPTSTGQTKTPGSKE